MEVIKGAVRSFGLTRPMSGSSRGPADHGYDGWRVMYEYQCFCGRAHTGQALNVWTKSTTDVIETICPVSEKPVQLELTAPSDPSLPFFNSADRK